jgi:LuxR family maltose regulon positive regulatory protein
MGGNDMSVIITKVVLPKKQLDFLTRPRLLHFLDQHVERRLVLISAPAGYGKTALLADYAHQIDMPVCWYTLDESDRDPRLFLSYLVASMQQRFSDFGEETDKLLADKANFNERLDTVISTFINEIYDSVPTEFVIVLDGYQYVDDCHKIQTTLESLLRYLPQKCHLIIASRTLPSLVLTELAAQQEVAGLSTSDLAFTKEEIETLLNGKYNLDLPPDRLEELIARTEGWITGILLISPTPNRGMFDQMTRMQGNATQVFNYLNKEVFNPQLMEVQRFLKTTSVLKGMNPSLCDKLLGIDNSQNILESLQERNLFTHKLEGGRIEYRYHHLFGEFLNHKLREEDPRKHLDIHLKAAELFESTGEQALAIEHYLQGQAFLPAARLIETMIGKVPKDVLADWTDALPSDILFSEPRLLVSESKMYVEQGDITRGEELCQQAYHALQQRDDEECLVQALISRAYVLYHKGKYERAIADCHEALSLLINDKLSSYAYERWVNTGNTIALETFGEKYRGTIAQTHHVIGLCYGAQGRILPSIKELERVKILFQQVNDAESLARLQRDLGDLYTVGGELPEAEICYEQSMDYWRKQQDIGALGSLIGRLGVHNYLRGQYQQAVEAFDEALKKVRETGYRLEELRVLTNMADLQRDAGNLDRAQEIYEEGLEIAEKIGADHLVNYVLCAMASACHLAGERGKAQKLLHQAIERSEESGSDHEIALCRLIQGITYYEDENFTSASDYLSQAREAFEVGGARRELARTHLHLAQCLYLQEDMEEVRAHLEDVATLVKQLDHDQFIVVEGQRLLPLIEYAASQNIGNGYFAEIKDRIVPPTLEPSKKARVKAILEGIRAVERMLKISALGPAQVQRNAELVTKAEWDSTTTKELFYFFLAHPEGLRKEQVINTFWSDIVPQKANSIFHSTAYRLRRALYPETLLYEDGLYRFNTDLNYWYDTERFKSLLDAAERAPTPEEKGRSYQAAIDLYRGDYLEEFYSDWCYPLRDDLQAQYMNALMTCAELRARAGKYEEAIELYRKVIDKDSYREDAYREAMKCCALMGDRASAIKYFKRCEQSLRDELGVAPMDETIHLYGRILEGNFT